MKKLFLSIIILFVFLLTGCSSNTENSFTEVSSLDNKYSLSIPNSINYRISSKENNSFSFDLVCVEDEMFIFGNTILKEDVSYDLLTLVNNDRDNYLANTSGLRDVSEVIKVDLEDYLAYSYTYYYSDANYGSDFFVKVAWIETDSFFCVLNFEIVEKNSQEFMTIFDNIICSFRVL